MTTTIELSIVRIRAPDGRTIGAGFLLADRQVLTCAHVVAAVLGLPEDTPETPQAEVRLDFPLVAPGHILTARVIHWQPESDIAGLELDGDSPAGARPVRLVTAQDLWGHAFRAFGFPAGYEDGVWASGVLRGRQAAGWVQIEDVKEPGYWVQPGFSGTAVWDEQLNGVVGMAVAADTDRGTKAAFMIPAYVLVGVWPELEVIFPTPVGPLLTELDPGCIASSAEALGISVRELISALIAAQLEWKEGSESGAIAIRTANITRLTRDSFVTKLLARYYTVENLKNGNLIPYSFEIDGQRIDTSIATKHDWVHLSIELGGVSEQCQLTSSLFQKTHVPTEYAIKHAARLLASVERKERRIWNSPIYRLIDLCINHSQITACFALDDFFHYRFTIGLLLEELIEALTITDLNIDEISAHRATFLPLRQQFLPDGYSLANFNTRMCAGGPLALFAIARQEPYDDFVIPIQRRSKLVADAQEMFSVVPKAFHQPMVAPAAEIRLSSTIYRELFEEMFGGKEAEKELRRLRHDWFLQESEPLRWLITHREACSIECVCFGINLLAGNYEFGILLTTHDPYFWEHYSRAYLPNWELARIEIVSSKDPQQLLGLIQRSDWTGEGLFVLVEGLKRLKELNPGKVNLPNTELLFQ